MRERRETEVTLKITHYADLPAGWVNKIERSFYDWSFAQGVEVSTRVTEVKQIRGEDPLAKSFQKSVCDV